MKTIKLAPCLLLTISLIIILFCVSVILPTFSVRYYLREFEKYRLSETMRISQPDLQLVVKNLQRYMAGLDDDLDAVATVDGAARSFFNQREILHMEDVRVLFRYGFVALGISAVVFIASAFYIVKNKYYYETARCVMMGVFVFLGGFGGLAAIIALNFDKAFVIFHELFFNNDLWLLDPRTDLLINMLPLEFFINISKTIAVYFLGGMAAVTAVCMFVSIRINRRRYLNKV